MDLILWRHALTEDGSPDHLRRLTARGEKDAVLVARWLDARLTAGPVRVLASPTTRTRQTAQALRSDHEVSDALGPEASAVDVLSHTGWPQGDATVIVVGHNPWIGELAALVCSGRTDRWAIRKGGLWWFTHRPGDDGRAEVLVKAVISPELLR
jgi:phosphohistidine phosphatase